MAVSIVRVRPDQDVVSVFVYDLQSSVILSPGFEFNADHPVVKQCPWAFDSDVEDASAEPGRKRSVRRTSTND